MNFEARDFQERLGTTDPTGGLATVAARPPAKAVDRAAPQLTPPQQDSVLGQLLEHISRELQFRTGEFLDRAEQGLNDSLAHALGPDERNVTRAAARWLTDNRTTLQQGLYQKLARALTTQPATTPDVDYSELEVLEEQDLRVTLSRARLVQKVVEQGKHEVAATEASLAALRQSGLSIVPGALAPGQLADGFLAALRESNVPAPAQERLMEIYGDRGVESLIAFYQGVNKLLRDFGVKPHFQITQLTPSQRDAPRQAAWNVESARDSLATLPLPDWRPGTVRDMLARQFVLAPALSFAGLDPTPYATQVEAIMLETLADPRISTRVRGEMNRVLATLVLHCLPAPEEFVRPESPIRLFLRQLTLLGYRDADAPLREFDMLQTMVARIVGENGNDLDTFHSGAEALYTLARREVRRLLLQRTLGDLGEMDAVPLTVRTAADEARRQVTIELREHILGTSLLAEAQEFVLRLLGPWMMVRYQRYGHESRAWAEARTFATLFFDALRPASEPKERPRKSAVRRQVLMQARLRTGRARQDVPGAPELLDWLERYFAWLDARATGEQELRPTGTAFLAALPVVSAS